MRACLLFVSALHYIHLRTYLFARFYQGLSTIGVQQIDRVVEVVEETLKGKELQTVHYVMVSMSLRHSFSKFYLDYQN